MDTEPADRVDRVPPQPMDLDDEPPDPLTYRRRGVVSPQPPTRPAGQYDPPPPTTHYLSSALSPTVSSRGWLGLPEPAVSQPSPASAPRRPGASLRGLFGQTRVFQPDAAAPPATGRPSPLATGRPSPLASGRPSPLASSRPSPLTGVRPSPLGTNSFPASDRGSAAREAPKPWTSSRALGVRLQAGAEPPAATLRQRVAEWCRPAPPAGPPPLDYDTGSDSEQEEPSGGGGTTLTPSQQLQAFRRRMNAASSGGGGWTAGAELERPAGQYGGQAGSGASHLVPYSILLLALLFFGALGLSYLSLTKPSEEAADGRTDVAAAGDSDAAVAMFPICGQPGLELGCVERERLESAVQLLAAVQPALVAAARDALCGRRENRTVPLTELARAVDIEQTDLLRDLAVVVAYNGQLGLRADLQAQDGAMWAEGVSTPWLCRIAATLLRLVHWAGTLGAVIALALALRAVLSSWRRYRHRQQQELFQMVEDIMEVVKQHSLSSTGTDKPYVAVDHVRDQLLTPAERCNRQKTALWQRAVRFIRDRESRVREECVLVAGESQPVWRWLPSSSAAGAAAGRRRVWLGQAFQTSSGVNTPVHTRTPCLKIRHMFDPSCETGTAWMQEIRDALLEKCEDIVVLHMAVDERNTEGLVYVKCRSDDDALSAFKRIQGCWFDGRLVSVKFIRLERYHERYPDAVGATEPLRPSNQLRRSLTALKRPQAEDD